MTGDDLAKLEAFVRESNAIEGIMIDPTPLEIGAHVQFLETKDLTIRDLEVFVAKVARGAALRRHPGMDVRVGHHIPPPGGVAVETALFLLLRRREALGPYLTHRNYETLHPFMDGNGRSGRVLWLHQMRAANLDRGLAFLHAWYYQSLAMAG